MMYHANAVALNLEKKVSYITHIIKTEKGKPPEGPTDVEWQKSPAKNPK